MQVQHLPMSARSLPSATRTCIDEHRDLAQQFILRPTGPDGMRAPSSPDLAFFRRRGHRIPICAYYHDPRYQLDPNQWSEKVFGKFFQKGPDRHLSPPSPPARWPSQPTALFFACRAPQLANFWQFHHRETQSGIHGSTRQPPANIPNCLPPSHSSSAASHLQPEFSAFTFHAVLLQLKADLTATPGLFADGSMGRMRVAW